MNSPISKLHIAVLKESANQNISVRQWCLRNGINYNAYQNLIYKQPTKQGKLLTFINVVNVLKGGVLDVE